MYNNYYNIQYSIYFIAYATLAIIFKSNYATIQTYFKILNSLIVNWYFIDIRSLKYAKIVFFFSIRGCIKFFGTVHTIYMYIFGYEEISLRKTIERQINIETFKIKNWFVSIIIWDYVYTKNIRFISIHLTFGLARPRPNFFARNLDMCDMTR